MEYVFEARDYTSGYTLNSSLSYRQQGHDVPAIYAITISLLSRLFSNPPCEHRFGSITGTICAESLITTVAHTRAHRPRGHQGVKQCSIVVQQHVYLYHPRRDTAAFRAMIDSTVEGQIGLRWPVSGTAHQVDRSFRFLQDL